MSRISKAALAGPDQPHDPGCRRSSVAARAQLRLPAGDRLQRAEGPPQPLPLLVVPAAAAEAGSAPEALAQVWFKNPSYLPGCIILYVQGDPSAR